MTAGDSPNHSALDLTLGAVRIKSCRHGPMAFLTGDSYIGRSLDMYGEYSDQEITLLSQLIGPGGVMIEAGSNIGTHTIALSRLLGPSGRLYAFEPIHTNFQLLCTNLTLNQVENVTTWRAALGQTMGTVSVSRLGFGLADNYGGFAVGQGSDQVPLVTIDSLNLSRCDLIKLDVEGFEAQALAGAEHTLRTLRPILYVENDKPHLHQTLIRAIAAQDYRLWWDVVPLFNPANFNGISDNIFTAGSRELFSLNLLCQPRETAKAVTNLGELTDLDAPHPFAPKDPGTSVGL